MTNMGNCKIPLDKLIQNHIWQNKVWNEEYKWWIMDDITILLFLIIRGVFDKREFKAKYVYEIEKRIEYIDCDKFYDLAYTVFFKFTDKLIMLIKERKYENIIKQYLSFREY